MPETEPNPPAKGTFTSEFWLTVLGVVALVGLVLHGDLDGDWAAGAIGFACFGYSASRAVVKRAQVTGDADIQRAVVNAQADVDAAKASGTAQVADFKADLALLAVKADPTDTVAAPTKARASSKKGG